MSNKIRKISIGSDYKNDAMHYSVGQEVYGGHNICNILYDDNDLSYNIRFNSFNKYYVLLYHRINIINSYSYKIYLINNYFLIYLWNLGIFKFNL